MARKKKKNSQMYLAWESRSQRERNSIIILAAVLAMVTLTLVGVAGLFNINNNYVTTQECASFAVDYHLENSNYSFWEYALMEYRVPIMIFIFMIAAAWLIHGFQLRLLA